MLNYNVFSPAGMSTTIFTLRRLNDFAAGNGKDSMTVARNINAPMKFYLFFLWTDRP